MSTSRQSSDLLDARAYGRFLAGSTHVSLASGADDQHLLDGHLRSLAGHWNCNSKSQSNRAQEGSRAQADGVRQSET